MLTNPSTYPLRTCKPKALARHTFISFRNVMHLRGRSKSDRRHGQCRVCSLSAFKLPNVGRMSQATHRDHPSTNTSSPMCHYGCIQRRTSIKTPGSHDKPCAAHREFASSKPWKFVQGGYSPVVPFGNTALSMAICPCNTRVKERRCSAVGVPKCRVRVTSVVPSRYCPKIQL